MESLHISDVCSTMVINTDASFQGAGISWIEHRRAIHTPQQRTRQIRREDAANFIVQGWHTGWARRTEAIHRSRMTRRRARRLNRCRSRNALDDHRHDHGDNNDGTQSMETVRVLTGPPPSGWVFPE